MNYTVRVIDRLLRFDTSYDNIVVTLLPFAQTPNAPYEIHRTSTGDGRTVTVRVDPSTSDYLLPGGVTSLVLDDTNHTAYIKIPEGGLSPAYVQVTGSGSSAATPSQGIMTFGLDTDAVGTNPIGKYGNIHFVGVPFVGSLSCVTPPTTAAAIFDVKFSHDNGVTWTSIFRAGSPYQYPVGTTGLIMFTVFASVNFAVGDLLRVDVTQSGGAAGIEGVIRWAPVGSPIVSTISGKAHII